MRQFNIRNSLPRMSETINVVKGKNSVETWVTEYPSSGSLEW